MLKVLKLSINKPTNCQLASASRATVPAVRVDRRVASESSDRPVESGNLKG